MNSWCRITGCSGNRTISGNARLVLLSGERPMWGKILENGNNNKFVSGHRKIVMRKVFITGKWEVGAPICWYRSG